MAGEPFTGQLFTGWSDITLPVFILTETGELFTCQLFTGLVKYLLVSHLTGHIDN
jgi:hypothetical protein